MVPQSIWISGSSQSGKTTRLVELFNAGMRGELDGTSNGRRNTQSRRRKVVEPDALGQLRVRQAAPAVLAIAANGDNRIELADRIAAVTEGKFPVRTTTPLGFFQDEVTLFWPLLIQRLNLRAQFPVRLRPETEQELATQLWRPELEQGIWQQSGVNEYRFVRRVLDVLLLAGTSGTAPEDIQSLLETGLAQPEPQEEVQEQGELFPVLNAQSSIPTVMGEMLLRWRNWCLERGFLTYGIINELYWRYLLAQPTYQQHLTRRYQLVLADDVDDYPAIARHLFEFLLDQGVVGVFTYNPDGGIRTGLGADPDYMAVLASRCQVETLVQRPVSTLDDTLELSLADWVSDPTYLASLPEPVQSIQTTSRAQLLRQTAEVVIEAVRSKQVQPQDIAIIAPGLDAIARYTLVEILTSKGIPVESLNDQRPLSSSPIIRALLTLLALVYPGLGRLVDRDAVAEMLVVLSTRYGEAGEWESRGSIPMPAPGAVDGEESSPHPLSTPDIDPVRAGLLADYCFEPHPEQPNLLPVKVFPRWDRLGHRATAAYEAIVQWLEVQRSQQQQRLIPSAVHILDRAIQRFLWNGSYLPYDQLAALRELLETAQHYWEVDERLRKGESSDIPPHTTVGRFIQMLRRGTVTANPYPVRSIGPGSQAVTLATIFQYRSSRRFHQWQFWLDAGSPLWSKGGAATLFAAPLFLQHRFGRLWTPQDEIEADEERLRRILRDLLGRVGERIYLCHSDFAVNGQEQTGPLLSLVNASVPLFPDFSDRRSVAVST